MDKRINDLIIDGHECEYLDFKDRQYSKDNNIDLIKDIMSMANSFYEGDKYIIIGIKDHPDGKEIKGVDPKEFIDSAVYIQVLLSNVEPDIQFDYFKYEFEGKVLGIFKIHNNHEKPYMMKRKYDKLNEGLCLIRKGSQNAIAKRRDFDFMYKNQGSFELAIQDHAIHAVHDREGCASTEILISNNTSNPVTIVSGGLTIKNELGEILTQHRVYGLDKYVGADFKLSMLPNTEVVGQLLLGFTSSDPMRLDLDEYGVSSEKFIFELSLWDARGNLFSASKIGSVYANGDFLRKVKQGKGIRHKFRTH